MSYAAPVDARNTEETVSLTSLESGADDFDRRMIQTVRDARRNDAPTPKVHAFSKARVRPRVGVTLENLERHNAKNSVTLGPNAHVKFQSPPSSSGSTRSDPALNVPAGWGRKGRVRRNWMRDITTDEKREPVAQEDTVDRLALDPEHTPPRDADEPRQSIEDSPLSHKSSFHGTPSSQRRRSIEDWSFDMNEASLIASTPYRPRNTMLEDIRQREIESLKEQGVATDRLDRIRETSPEEIRRPRSASTKSATVQENVTKQEETSPEQGLSELRLHKRNKSWQAVGKAPAMTGEGTEGSPIVVYKRSSETIGMVDSRLLAGQSNVKPPAARRDDSRDLLRRLARASSTPSPGRPELSRPQVAPTSQTGSSSRTMVTETSPSAHTVREGSGAVSVTEHIGSEKGHLLAETDQAQNTEKGRESRVGQLSTTEIQRNTINATPKPAERSTFNPKTPVVTGAWVDTMVGTPGPSTVQKPSGPSTSSTSPQKGSPRKQLPQDTPAEDQQPTPEVSKPTLPRSVLGALVEEARASGQRRPTDYGDSTINSLEELMAPIADTSESGEPDEDTIPLDISTKPRTEAERRRQEELFHIQNMDRRLRSTRTSLRDTSRGIRRVEEQIERGGERTTIILDGNENEKSIDREYKCPCVETGGHQSSFWQISKLLFYDKRLKPKRRGWGLTWLSIFLLTFVAWFILENICCEIWGHPTFASSYKGYGVVWGAPEYPYVLPTMTYRALIKPWWRPLHTFLSWIWGAVGFENVEAAPRARTTATATGFAERILVRDQARVAFEEEAASVLGMTADEVVR
ncbi:uncharacterized protein CC84DRAFT_1162338 [Paraphaeosphaeria sporulosa]|uniref:Uncharacterized protein n=1 Tax=Paraphaeosphaeria sporulosa TaxID=1460663 RepID=A0A177CN96_9PLEO|nr:uncharacterized protein CC84DRAFT_1162338 [Paraphaeosphaeria sporulosa]OAG08370.1 hypothetical protein CC84DRAFT_1162338 [Paraphaeosphaeria sporulosa]